MEAKTLALTTFFKLEKDAISLTQTADNTNVS